MDTPATVGAMQAADLCLIPARPSVADIEAARRTVRSLTKLGKAFAFVLNQCPPARAVRTSDAFRALQLAGAVSGISLALRANHVDALAEGLGVPERDSQGKAAAEIRSRTGHGPANMAVIRHFAINLVRAIDDKKSLKLRRKRAGWDTTYLAKILGPLAR